MEPEHAEKIASLSAGLVAGASGVLLGHPLDTLKVRMQIGHALELQSSKGFAALKQLYRGVGPPVMTAGIMQSISFTLYEAAKRQTKERFQLDHLGSVFFGGATSGLCTSVLTTPIGVVKVQQQIRSTKGMIVCSKEILQIHGWRAFYRAYPLMAFMESFGRGVYLWIYEATKMNLKSNTYFRKMFPSKRSIDSNVNVPAGLRNPSGQVTELDSELPERIVAASMAGMLSWLVVYPFDVVKSKLQVDLYKQSFRGVSDCFRKTYKDFGFRGFFRGIGFTIIRAAPVAATILPIYEFIKPLVLSELR